MQEDQSLIKEISNSLYKPLEAVANMGAVEYLSYHIDCSKLKDFSEINIYEDELWKPMFDKLRTITCPVLYWFEITSITNTEDIINAIQVYKDFEGRRNIPAFKKKPPHGTNVLYVGKVIKDIKWRIKTHLGYYIVARTQGLQLYHWCKELDLMLKLHIYTFTDNMAPLMSVLERGVANRFRPLLGKHK